MNELTITVIIPGEREATYRFNDQVVHIGRSPECHLAICHEAVPRELCRVWLEDDGIKVRLEESPCLTNPIINKGINVRGGICGTKLKVIVGPVKLVIEPASKECSKTNTKSAHKDRQKRAFLILSAVLALMLLFLLMRSGSDTGQKNLTSQLPENPFCPADKIVQCDDPGACREQARLEVTRAEQLLSAQGLTVKDRLRALLLLQKAAQRYGMSDALKSAVLNVRIQRIEENILGQYKRDVVGLTRALKRSKGARENALQVTQYLGGCHADATAVLQSFITQTSE